VRAKLTPEVQDKITEALRIGAYAKVAARYAGVGETTFYTWMERGAEDDAAGKDTKYRAFRESIKDAEALAEVRACGIISNAMGESWQAAGYYLERKFPTRWSRHERREHSGTLQVAPINMAALSEDERIEAIRLAAKVQGEPIPEELKE